MRTLLILLSFSAAVFSQTLYYYAHGKKVKLAILHNAPSRDYSANLHVKDSYNRNLVIHNSIIFGLKDGTNLAQFRKNYSLTTLKRLGHNIFTCNTPTAQNAITLANRLYSDTSTTFAMPNIEQKRLAR